MTKFTSGPWTVGRDGYNACMVYGPHEGVCQVFGMPLNTSLADVSAEWDDGLANARLISSAPDMYEAGQKMMALVEHAQAILTEYLTPNGMSQADAMNMMLRLLDGPYQREAQGAMRAALSRAEGGT